MPSSHGQLDALAWPRPEGLASRPIRDLAAELLHRLQSPVKLSGPGMLPELLSMLASELEVVGNVAANRFGPRHLAERFGLSRGFPDGIEVNVNGATVIEMGCGSVNPLAALLPFVLLGARFAIGIDACAPQDPAAAARGLARCATYLLADPRLLLGDLPVTRGQLASQLGGFDLLALWQGDATGVDSGRMQLRIEDAGRTSVADAAADYVFSASFLEHVEDADAVVAELARITRPGGLGAHTIDGIDHRHYGDPALHPLEFLCDGSGASMVHESNRIRPLQFAAIFERHGFQVLGCCPHLRVPVDAALRAGFAAPFCDLATEELEVVQLGLQVRRLQARQGEATRAAGTRSGPARCR